MDLRAVGAAGGTLQDQGAHLPSAPLATRLLAVGSEIAAEARRAVKVLPCVRGWSSCRAACPAQHQSWRSAGSLRSACPG